jgi:hypothetical protein
LVVVVYLRAKGNYYTDYDLWSFGSASPFIKFWQLNKNLWVGVCFSKLHTRTFINKIPCLLEFVFNFKNVIYWERI